MWRSLVYALLAVAACTLQTNAAGMNMTEGDTDSHTTQNRLNVNPLFLPSLPQTAAGASNTTASSMSATSAGDTAWLLTAAALVSVMTPGLAFFYGGLVESTTVLNTLMMSYVCAAIVTVRIN